MLKSTTEQIVTAITREVAAIDRLITDVDPLGTEKVGDRMAEIAALNRLLPEKMRIHVQPANVGTAGHAVPLADPISVDPKEGQHSEWSVDKHGRLSASPKSTP